MKNLIIGCGSAIESIYGQNSIIAGREHEWYPSNFHKHKNSITVDIDPRSRPDVILDICTTNIVSLTRKLGVRRFEFVALENLPVSIYLDSNKVMALARNLLLITRDTAEILIPRAFDSQRLINVFESYGFFAKLSSCDPGLIYKQISLLTNNRADEYIINYKNRSRFSIMARNRSLPYILFSRT